MKENSPHNPPYLREYAEIMKNPPEKMREYFAAEDNFLLQHIAPEMKILDVGCGNGRNLLVLAPAARQAVGIDIDPSMTQLAARQLEGLTNVTIQTMDGERMDFKDNTFDLVYATFNLLGVPELPDGGIQVIKEMIRVAKPKSSIVFTVWSEKSFDFSREFYALNKSKKIELDRENLVVKTDWGNSQRYDERRIKLIFTKLGYSPTVTPLTDLFYGIEITKKPHPQR